ncbi:hypothetical protein TRV_04738, partial [Trichophyton verrucosum HKI 0517]
KSEKMTGHGHSSSLSVGNMGTSMWNSRLPFELPEEICSYLGTHDLHSLKSTCNAFSGLHIFWKEELINT